MRKIINLFFAGFVGFAAFAEPTVTDVVAKQRYPWNGLVDITCKVSGINAAVDNPKFVLSAVFPDSQNVRKLSQFWVMRDGVKSDSVAADANGNYCLLWNAKGDLGEVRYTNMVVRVTIKGSQKVQLWEGGPYWATTNIGSENPEEYGYYFWWGDTVGYKRENNKWVASDGSNSNFSFTEGNVPTYGKSNSALQSEGWITVDGVLTSEHDAARKHWGGDWRMPTIKEVNYLCSECDWTRTTVNGVSGYVVRGRDDYASASIFLPCAGFGKEASLNDTVSSGYYWSSTPYSDGVRAWYFNFFSSNHWSNRNFGRNFGQPIRPVQELTK